MRLLFFLVWFLVPFSQLMAEGTFQLERSDYPIKLVDRGENYFLWEADFSGEPPISTVGDRSYSVPSLDLPEKGGDPLEEMDLAGASPFPVYSQWVNLPAPGEWRVRAVVEEEAVERGVNLSLSQTLSQRDLSKTSSWASLAGPFFIGGSYWGLLEVTPSHYDPERGEFRHALRMRISLECDPSFRGEHLSPRQRVQAWREVERGLGLPSRDQEGQMNLLGHYVIILPNVQNALQAVSPLVEWKRRMGYKVTVATTEEVGNTAESIRGWLVRAWNQWEIPPTYVLMIGDEQGDLRLPTYFDNQQPQQSWFMSDQKFVQFVGEGDNNPDMWIPEAFIGRLPASNMQELQRMVAKILGYERNPYRGEPWVEGAVLIAQGVRSCIHTNVAIRELLQSFGYARNRFFEAYNDYPQEVDLNIINRGVDQGVGFVNFRGYNNWANYTPAHIRDRRNGWKLPVVWGMVCATNDWSNRYAQNEAIGEAWMRSWQNNDPAGAVACFGPTDLFTHTWFNNTMDGEIFLQMVQNGIQNMGPLTLLAKLSLLRNFPSYRTLGNGYTVGYYFFTYNILGDPSLLVRTKEPVRIEVNHPATLPRGTRWLHLQVREENDRPVERAYVHIYRDEERRYGGFTDRNGSLTLELPPLDNGEYRVTVTGNNLVPYEGNFSVEEGSSYCDITGWRWVDDPGEGAEGDGDGIVEAGEVGLLFIDLTNWSSDTIVVRGVPYSHTPFISVEGDTAVWHRLPPGEVGEGGGWRVTINPRTPHQTEADLSFSLISPSGENQTRLRITIEGYHLRMIEPVWQDERPLLPGGRAFLKVRVENRKDEPTDSLNAILYCSDRQIQIVQAESPVGVVEGQGRKLSYRWFELISSPQAYQGAEIPFALLLYDAQGKRDSLTFTLSLGPLTVTSPQGPDRYGYWCFDSRDTLTGQAPSYQRFSGQERLNLTDPDDRNNQRGDHGMRAILDLPFEFTFYGERFRRITVSTNGWLAMGESDQVGWNNQELGSPLAPPGMIAGYWNDLWGGTVWVGYNQDEGVFIVEWRDFQSERGGPISFAIALYDPNVHFTRTGDGIIEVHYRELPVRNLIGRDYQEEETTIGICSPDRRSLLQVAFAGRYHPATADLRPQMALRFTTGPWTRFGSIEGWVSEEGTGQPLSGVRVMVDGTGLFSLTNPEGYFHIPNVPVGNYSITAFRLFYNRARRGEVEVRENETVQLEFSLTQPHFDTDVEGIDIAVPPQQEDSLSFLVWNTGNGPLEYELQVRPITEEPRRWEMVFDFEVSTACSSNTWIQGIATDGEFLYVSAKNNIANDFPHWIYVLNKEGELVRRFNQYTFDSTAIRGYAALDWKDGNLLAVEKNNILEITTEGELVRVIPTPERPAQAVVWAPERGTVFTKSVTGNTFYELSLDGQVVRTYRTPETFRTYGLGWYPYDRDGYPLYIFRSNPNALADYGTVMQVWKMNPATNDYKLERSLVLAEGDNVQDCAITRRWDPLRWTFIGLINRPNGDHSIGFDLAPNYTWISYRPNQGSLLPGMQQRFWVKFIAGDLPERTYRVFLTIVHNAEGEEYNIPVWFTVGWEGQPSQGSSLVPQHLTLSTYPNPFNHTLRVAYSIPYSGPIQFTLADIQGRTVWERQVSWSSPGEHIISLDLPELPAGLYWLMAVSSSEKAVQKVVLVK